MRPFVAVQVAFGLVVLFVGSLLVLSFARLSSVNPGFATSDVLLLSLEAVQRVDRASSSARLCSRCSIGSAAFLACRPSAPPSPTCSAARGPTHVRVPGTADETIETTMAPVTPGFFETMNIPLLAGRAFVRARHGPERPRPSWSTRPSPAATSVASRRSAARSKDASAMDNDNAIQYEIVGVAADTRYDLRKPAAPTIYIPLPLRTNGTVHVRVTGEPAALATRLREEVRAANPSFRVTSITTQSALVDRTLLRERLLALLSGFFALVGLVLAAVGLYGVLSYSVVQRTREIGIRVALGARQLARGPDGTRGNRAAPRSSGVAGGLAGGLYLSRFVKALLFEVTPLDFWSLALPLGTLLLAAALAAALPALRAARVDPVVALRYE